MRSVTSYFNAPLYRKNLLRFWPIWACYLVIWLFALPLAIMTEQNRYGVNMTLFTARTQPLSTLGVGLVMAVGFAVISAMAVFSYLYNHRAACMMHSLPPRREALFFTNYLSGLSFMLLPNLVVFALTLAVEAILGVLTVKPMICWLLVVSAICLFFYSFAVFCAMFTGHILALPAFYGILNALAMGITVLMNAIVGAFLHGYSGVEDGVYELVRWLTPSGKISQACSQFCIALQDGTTAYTYFGFISSGDDVTAAERLAALKNGTFIMGVYVVAAVALTLIALAIYRRRHMETAGDVVTVALVRPLFRYGVAVCVGLSFGLFTAEMLYAASVNTTILLILLWAVVGYFVAEMLLRKSFRVLSAWKGALGVTLVMCAILVGLRLDVVGFQTRLPDLDQVEEVYVSGLNSAPDDDAYYIGTSTKDRDVIEEVAALHQAIVSEPDRWDTDELWDRHSPDETGSVRITYYLKNGSTMSRDYHVPFYEDELTTTGTTTWAVQQLLENRVVVAEQYGFDNVEANGRLVEAYIDYMVTPDGLNIAYDTVFLDASAQELEQLWQAVRQDFDAGNIGVRYLLRNSTARNKNTCTSDLNFTVEYRRPEKTPSGIDSSIYTDNLTITLTPQAENTLAMLVQLGAFDDGYGLKTNSGELLDIATP